nr:MAG TPA: hypothetical protein [Caudoviricetes sp.]
MPPPGGITTERLRRTTRHLTTRQTSAPTRKATAPPRRAQARKNKCCHHVWRAVLSPPRLPALWGGFNAGVRHKQKPAVLGGP